jgi:hypothetical protein
LGPLVIVMFFDPNTISPITMAELGLYANSRRLVVCCPRGYFRRANVRFYCKKYGVKQVYTLEELAKEAMERVRCSEERGEEVMERVECGKGRGNSNNERVSWFNYL